ncbi:SPFH domain-containing protein [Burkholderia sp. JKS000303]|uniref:SPFH domain-containing protein n=1 Tax=Burkholderia sp. JKS000303 TaxID=1938747 RepID=UPI000BF6591D|nr:SPFH domain/Band 7 family protein [Burkholderia sp. JKS000303]
MNAITRVLSAALVAAAFAVGAWDNLNSAVLLCIIAVLIALSVRGANVLEKFVILRIRKMQSVEGAGFFMRITIPDNVDAGTKERIQTTSFNTEQAPTKDTVPVNVDAAIFWHVHDVQKATLAITDYRQAIERVAQASVREMIGASMSASLLSDRKTVGMHLRDKIGRKISDWSVPVQPGHVVRMTSTADLSGSRKLP